MSENFTIRVHIVQYFIRVKALNIQVQIFFFRLASCSIFTVTVSNHFANSLLACVGLFPREEEIISVRNS